ncbi:uncharacterized protein LOC124536708 [Vanessa cardui]|uniref:uncharacterized protein LOC124529604 n=1 Tax=Vanessa cardui TaxID=171605 RepID=UPI001F145548|nr:uncharacterized protein LOC124529604 [Vanessa cardui]XP_046969231.1 uncharacterized protein LOC124536708 [Vanessa cardui]
MCCKENLTEKMNSKVYKSCAVPLCKNTSLVNPNKLFVYVPHKKIIRDKWLKLARRNPNSVATNTPLYFCEDHFDLPNDMENYMEYHIMGSVSQVRMKPGCMPKKFICQPDRLTRMSDLIERPHVAKKRRMMIVEECEKQFEESRMVTENLQSLANASSSSVQQTIEEATQPPTPRMLDKSVQVYISKTFRSKAIQTKASLVNQMTSPLKPSQHSVSTSPFKIKTIINSNPSKPSVTVLSKIIRKIEQSDSDTSYTPSLAQPDSSPSTKSLQIESISDCSEMIDDDKKREDLNNLNCTLRRINNNPRAYIGIPLNCFYLVNVIQEQTGIPFEHILLCLKKIKLNNSFRELADDFGMDKSYPSKIFFKNIPVIASVLRPFIVKLDKDLIKKNLPMAFRHKYSKVTCLIDCLEIEVQKPSKALNQALSWSDYKKANTIKYLVSCTPNGLINYISNGYGGRITDTCIVETSDFSKCLQPGMWVMADRGFKHIEVYLRQMGVRLVRPPSVVSGAKLTKAEAKETKQIASLRIHVERLIRRIREFNMLKPHACLNLSLVKVLDEVITIACGLINVQDALIK